MKKLPLHGLALLALLALSPAVGRAQLVHEVVASFNESATQSSITGSLTFAMPQHSGPISAISVTVDIAYIGTASEANPFDTPLGLSLDQLFVSELYGFIGGPEVFLFEHSSSNDGVVMIPPGQTLLSVRTAAHSFSFTLSAPGDLAFFIGSGTVPLHVTTRADINPSWGLSTLDVQGRASIAYFEPVPDNGATIALLALGLAGVMMLRRCKRTM